MKTAVGNLPDNALRHSPDDGVVLIEVTSAVSAGGLRAPRTLSIAVSDSGPGVALAIRPRIFERFFSTERERQGTGLGLSIVAAVVRPTAVGSSSTRPTPAAPASC